jgi:broad specificity phosphatase PhoE
MSERTILLVRHGRSSHVHVGWIDLAGFLRWREAYEAAGIDASDVPPRELREIAGAAGMLAASDIRRAVESAHALAPSTPLITSSLLRELDLTPPRVAHLRLPLLGWALLIGTRMLVGKLFTRDEQERVREAARWLASLAEQHGTIVVVTHGSFRWALTKVMEAEGWRSEKPRRRSSHWSAWSLSLRA